MLKSFLASSFSLELDFYWLSSVLAFTITVVFMFTYWCRNYQLLAVLSGHQNYQFNKEKTYNGKEASVFSIRGRRKHMEDTFQALTDRYGDSQIGYYGVFDGHGGSKASAFTANMLHMYLKEAIREKVSDTKNEEQMCNAIKQTFIKTDKEFLKEAKTYSWMDGTTAVAAVIVRNAVKPDPSPSGGGMEDEGTRRGMDGSRRTGAVIYVANTGDSRAVLVRNGKAIPMSIDHKPDRDDEKKRIEKNGGRVVHFGTWRVEGILAVARALGDIHLKQWVIPDPEIKFDQLLRHDSALVLATDGVWDVVKNQDVADICTDALKKEGEIKEKLDYIARQITKTAFDRGSVDNITTLVVHLPSFV